MSAPTPAVRAVTYERDNHRCVSCGATVHLEWQHRQAVGMGGTKKRPRIEEGLTSCQLCNPAYEHSMQKQALRLGWKVPRWVDLPEQVPVFYVTERAWFELTATGLRIRVTQQRALEMMRAVYGPAYEGGASR